MRRLLQRATLLVWAWVTMTGALALDLVQGTELLLASPRALAGYGTVDARRLVLRIDTDRASVQVVVATPGGGVETVPGELAEGRLWVFDRGAWHDLATLLSDVGVSLRLEFADGRGFLVPPAPGSLPPGQRPPGAAPPAPGTRPGGDASAADDADDDDGADADDADDDADDDGDGDDADADEDDADEDDADDDDADAGADDGDDAGDDDDDARDGRADDDDGDDADDDTDDDDDDAVDDA